jgi:TPR repeat protein
LNGRCVSRGWFAGSALAAALTLAGAAPAAAATPDDLAAPTIRQAAELDAALASGDVARARALEEQIRALGASSMTAVEHQAQSGDPDARFAAGLLLSRGLLAPKDTAAACRYFVQAAETGHVAGEYHGALCLLGADPARAARLMKDAAARSHPAAQEAIGRACLDGRTRNLDCAVRNLAAAARAGRPSAQSLFAWMHSMGVGVEREPITALALYLVAARQGDLAAQNNLGELYETGVELALEKNPRRAALWYEGAARGGFGPAQYNLGRLYAAGIGVEYDVGLARLWLGKAEASGVPAASELLGQLRSGRRVPPR